MRKLALRICENKDADQLRGNREADQCLCFPDFKPLAIFCDRTAQFVSGLVGNPEDRFSHNEAHILKAIEIAEKKQNNKTSLQRKKVVSANCSLFRRNKKLFLSIPFLTAT